MSNSFKDLFIGKSGALFLFTLFLLLTFLVFIKFSISQSLGVNVASIFFVLIFIIWLVSFEVLNLLIDNSRSFFYNFVFVFFIGLFFVSNLESLIAFLIISVGFYESHRRFCKLKDIFNKFDFISILKDSIPVLMTTISLFVAILFTSLSIDDNKNPEQPISRQMFDFVFVPLESTVSLFTDNDVSNFLLEQINNGDDADQLIDVQVSIGDKLYGSINERILVNTKEINYISLVVVISMFLFFRIFSLIIMWVSFLAVWLVIKALLFYNIISLNKKKTSKEFVMFDG